MADRKPGFGREKSWEGWGNGSPTRGIEGTAVIEGYGGIEGHGGG